MKRHITLCIMIATILTSVFADEARDRVPEGHVAFVSVSNMATDPGMVWLRNAWHASPRQSGLRTFFAGVSYDEVAVAVMNETVASGVPVLLLAALEPGHEFTTAQIDGVIVTDQSGEASPVSIGGTQIRSVATLDPENDFGAYSVTGNVVIFGYDAEMIAEAVAAPSATAGPEFAAFSEEVDTASDGLLFAHNRNGTFAEFLRPLEKKWGMSLLLSAESLAWMGSAFDVVDSETVVGTIVFHTTDPDAVIDLEDDAMFLGEAFRRKFMAEAIQYDSSVETSETTVTLEFRVDGLESLWTRLFEQGVLSIIQP